MGKGHKERLLRLGSTARKELWRYLLIRDVKLPAGERHIFLSEEMRPLTRNGLGQMIARRGKEAGIANVRCSPHTFRHTMATSFLRNGGDISSLQTILGHSSLEMVRNYSRTLNSEDAMRAHERASPADSMGLK